MRRSGSVSLPIRIAALLLALCVLQTPGAQAQQFGTIQSPILTIESDRLFSGSEFGKRVAQEREADSAVLSAENRRIEAQLTEEERSLTERRATMDPEAFRALADAFDAKVQEIRRTQDAKARDLNQRGEADQVIFLQAVVPVLEQLMTDAGAAVLLERGSVFLSLNATDVTDLAIERINSAIGDGQHLERQ